MPVQTAGSSTKTNPTALAVLTTLFFMWGFITCMNDILIPAFKDNFALSYFQAFLVQFAFFGAYFIGSLIYFIISSTSSDPIQRIGYKNGILLGLGVSALACFLFYPAARFESYGFFLTALFVLGLGFTLLQITANPYVAIIGPSHTASSRLNLAQAFNSFGTTIAPLIGGYIVFEFFANELGKPTLEGVEAMYPVFALVFILVGVLIYFTALPRIESEAVERGFGALRFPWLVLGMVAIFTYVGGEVTVGSALINFFEEGMGLEKSKGDIFLAFYWGGAMIGRFLGAISLSEMQQGVKKFLLMAGVALLAFGVIYFAALTKSGFTLGFGEIAPFLGIVALNLAGFVVGRSLPARTLGIFASVNILLLLITIATGGALAFWSVIGIGLFNSIMWSNIFTLSIDGLGKYTSQGSSLLVMMVLGGALIPPLQGALADWFVSTGDPAAVQHSFPIALICYAYLMFYGFRGYSLGKAKVQALD
ncbi:MAG: L-fucose:H+ symporter permease [Bacteroidia bacterium]